MDKEFQKDAIFYLRGISSDIQNLNDLSLEVAELRHTMIQYFRMLLGYMFIFFLVLVWGVFFR